MKTSSRTLYLYSAIYVVIVSLSYPISKDGLRFSDPLTFMAMRYLIASLAVFALARNARLPFNKDTILLAFFTFLSTLSWVYGLRMVSPAQSAVLSYAMPLFAMPLSTLVLREKAPKYVTLGVSIGFAGVVLYGLTLASGGGSILGACLTISGAVFWAFYTILYRKTKNQDAILTVGIQLLLTGISFSVLIPFDFTVKITEEFLLDLGYVSLVSGFVTFILWNSLLRSQEVGRIVTITYAIPALTTSVEAFQTGRMPGILTVIGILLMFLGILVSRANPVRPGFQAR